MCLILRKKYIHSVRYVNYDLKNPKVFELFMPYYYVMYRIQQAKKNIYILFSK